MFELKLLKDLTNNLDSIRKPLNAQERMEIQKEQKYPYCGANGVLEYVDKYLFNEKILCIAEDGGSWGYQEKCTYIMPEPCWVNNHAHVLTAKENVSLEYLSIYLNFMDLNKYITGTTRGKLTKSALEKIPVQIPSYNQQLKVVEIITKAKNIIDKRQLQITVLDKLTQSLFLEMFGDDKVKDKNYTKMRLQEIAHVGSSKRVFVDELVNEGIPFFRGTEIGDLAEGNNISPELFITTDHYEKLKKSSGIPKIGDLLMPSICPDGRIWRVDNDAPFYFKDGRVLWVSFKEEGNNPIYIQFALKLKLIKDYLKIASGTTFAELKIFTLKNVELVIPPIEVQNDFAEKLLAIHQQKEKMKDSLVELESLYNALLQKAFKGELFQD